MTVVGTVAGYGDTRYEIIGEWRGYLRAYDPITRTEFKVSPRDFTALGDCEECGQFGVDPALKGADGRSVCDDCRDKQADVATGERSGTTPSTATSARARRRSSATPTARRSTRATRRRCASTATSSQPRAAPGGTSVSVAALAPGADVR